jgi:type II secretory pathway component PulC
MKRDFSPEEKLLRLIKSSAKKDADKDKLEIKAALPPSANGAPSGYKRNNREATRASSLTMPFKGIGINTKNVNLILVVTLIGLLVYFLADLLYSPYYKKEADITAQPEKEAVEPKEKAVPPIEPFSYYASEVASRNLFLPQESEVTAVQTGPSVEEISTGLSLIGIISGDRPQAIIEDKKTGKSYFLYKGGLVGQVKVMDILEDKVVMEYQGQAFELML